MALSAMFILEVVIVFSFIVTSLFMFIQKKNEAVLSVMLGILVTFISATSLPSNMQMQTVACWLCLVPAATGIIISVAKGKPNVLAKLCSMLTIILSVLGYYFLG